MKYFETPKKGGLQRNIANIRLGSRVNFTSPELRMEDKDCKITNLKIEQLILRSSDNKMG